MINQIDQKEFDMYALYCDRKFVVDPEKSREFNELKPNKKLLKKIDEVTKKSNIKIEVETGPILKMVLKPTRNKK